MTSVLVDDSFGPAQALQDVWMNRGQQEHVAHRSPTRLSLSPTDRAGTTTVTQLAISYFLELLS